MKEGGEPKLPALPRRGSRRPRARRGAQGVSAGGAFAPSALHVGLPPCTESTVSNMTPGVVECLGLLD